MKRKVKISSERERFILNIANCEWPRFVDDETANNEEQMAALQAEWESKEIEFCKSSNSPDELHAYADFLNWDFGYVTLLDVLRNPNCDFGTAELIFWRNQPSYYQGFKTREDVPAVNKDGWDFTWGVVRICENKVFKTSEIHYDPTDDHEAPLEDGKAQWPIPEIFRR